MKTASSLRIVGITVSLVFFAKLNSCHRNKGDFLFPDDEQLTHLNNGAPVTERTPPPRVDTEPKRKPPMFDTEPCPENMFFYRDEGSKTGICDCNPQFVYFPANETCHEVFQRGPCPPNHYVYLALNDSMPGCVPNPCKRDGYAMYRGICHEVRARGGPCLEDEALHVNETTFQLECYGAVTQIHVIIEAPKRSCPKGSRRSSLGICKLVL